jgi:hypothetical protein
VSYYRDVHAIAAEFILLLLLLPLLLPWSNADDLAGSDPVMDSQHRPGGGTYRNGQQEEEDKAVEEYCTNAG